jgi:T7 family holin superfamily II
MRGIGMTDEQLAAAKTAPAIAGATIYGLTLQDWVAIATLVYVALQVGLLMPKYWKLLIDWRRSRSQESLRGRRN